MAVVLLFALGVWLNFALAYERARAVSPDGEWVATAYIDGTPLTAENERVHIWRWWQPRFRWLGCQVLEAKNESPTRLLPPALTAELTAWKLRAPISKLNLVFPAAGGGVLNYKNFMTRQFLPMLETAKLRRIGLHALRHTAASAWIYQGIDLKRLQTWIGHGSIQLTLDRYGHLLKDEGQDAALAAAAQTELLG